jgi:hypothetical protein
MKAPSSTYRHWKISTVVRPRERYSLGMCPLSFPLLAANFAPVTERTVQTFMPASFHATSLGKGRHKKEEEHRSHVVTLLYSDSLGEFDYFFLDLEDNNEVAICASHGLNKAWRGAVAFKNVKEEAMVGCIVCFDKINKCHIGREGERNT